MWKSSYKALTCNMSLENMIQKQQGRENQENYETMLIM